MNKPNAIHHIAISTSDMKGQIDFFSDVLGMELQALFWMHADSGETHGFMRLGQSSVAFISMPENAQQATVIGQTHSGNGSGSSTPGTLQHIAFNVDTIVELLALRDRIRSKGVPATGPIHHGLCSSIYFAGPENLTLEIATTDQSPYPLTNNDFWIDPEVVKITGISEEELKRYRSPPEYTQPAEPVPQPEYDASKPHLHYPIDIYMEMLKAPDQVITEMSSDTMPPNKP